MQKIGEKIRGHRVGVYEDDGDGNNNLEDNQPAGPLVDPLGKIVNIEQIWKNGYMK